MNTHIRFAMISLSNAFEEKRMWKNQC